MNEHPKGTRLAIALREDWERWFHFCFAGFWIGVILAPLACFLLFRSPREISGLVAVMGILGTVGLLDLLKTSVLWILVGKTIVEVSTDPPTPGQPLEYLILLGRRPPGVKSMEAWLLLRRRTLRGIAATALEVPLNAASIEPERRRKIEGSLVVPSIPMPSLMEVPRLTWVLLVRIRFKGGFTHEEQHPFLGDSYDRDRTWRERLDPN